MFRVEEFKRQLDWMHQNIASSSSKTQELHEHTQPLGELFQRIDQVEVSAVQHADIIAVPSFTLFFTLNRHS